MLLKEGNLTSLRLDDRLPLRVILFVGYNNLELHSSAVGIGCFAETQNIGLHKPKCCSFVLWESWTHIKVQWAISFSNGSSVVKHLCSQLEVDQH
jgi:hypothetical protein